MKKLVFLLSLIALTTLGTQSVNAQGLLSLQYSFSPAAGNDGDLQINSKGIVAATPYLNYNVATGSLVVNGTANVTALAYRYTNASGGTNIAITATTNSLILVDSLSGGTDSVTLTVPTTATAGDQIVISSNVAADKYIFSNSTYILNSSAVSSIGVINRVVLYWCSSRSKWMVTL